MTTTHVAVYARYSTDRQDARSIDDQIRRCRAFATDRKYEVAAEFKDAAQSGATMRRADLQSLLAEARSRQCRFTALLVDDLSRLSRDLGDTWQLVYGDLAAAGVKVIDCTTGMASDGAGARLTFGAMALVNDTFLQLVKTETHRGLAGRALAGFHAGGSCFGYRTIPEPNPQDPEHPRAKVVIDDQQAEIVRRIFRERAEGKAMGAICESLNAEGVPAPADGATYKLVRGWSKSLLWFMLHNDRYCGITTWNKRQWFRDPVTKRRRYRERPESEWIRTEQPELRIIDQQTWDRVQGRHRKSPSGKGQGGTGRHEHLLSGLMRCGSCGGLYSVVISRNEKLGRSHASFGCSARHGKGATACGNSTTISEGLANGYILKAAMEAVQTPEFGAWLYDTMRATERARHQRQGEDPIAKLEAAVRAQESKVERVANTLVEVGVSDALKARLRQEEQKLRDLRQQVATATPARKVPAGTPAVTVEQVLAALENVALVAKKEPRRAREALSLLLEPVMLKPAEGGLEAEIRVRGNAKATLSGGPLTTAVGCGGRI